MSTYELMRDKIASKRELSEEKLEIMTTIPQDMIETVRDTVATKNGLSKAKVERVTSFLQDQTVAGKHESSEGKAENVTPTPDQADDERKRKYLRRLYRAALRDEWLTVNVIHKVYPKLMKDNIFENKDTVLHIAVAAESSKTVRFLVENLLQAEDLAVKNFDDNTAFCHVAATGKKEFAEWMLKKNKELPKIRGEEEMLPIHIAAMNGHQEMVEFLCDATKDYLEEIEDRAKLLHALIRSGLYDAAVKLLEKERELATFPVALKYYEVKETALHVFARTHKTSSDFANQIQEGVLKRCFNIFFGSKTKLTDREKLPQNLVKHLLEQVEHDASWIHEVILLAAELGKVEFLTVIIREYPEFIWKGDRNDHSVFHVAVLNRQKDIFKLINEIHSSLKKSILDYTDNEGNNILHLAGKLAPPDRLTTISGVALQLQEELSWFKEVRKLVNSSTAEAKNISEKSPKALFDEEHKELKERGERWMKDTANSCMIVATLIATVVFAAAFTVPGGIQEDTGTPHFIQNLSFITFVISNAISLVSSTCSILTFLSILTSRYAEEDFLSVLPRKLVVGLATLFLSIVTMMVVFCITTFIVFSDGMIWVPILVSVIASLPAILFTNQQWKLLSDVARSTHKISYSLRSSERSVFADKPNRGIQYCLENCWCYLQDCWLKCRVSLVDLYHRCFCGRRSSKFDYSRSYHF